MEYSISPFITVLMYIYPVACVFVPCIIYQAVLCRKRDGSEKIPMREWIWRYIFILYIYLVMKVVGFGSIWEIGKYGSVIRLDEIHLIPFQSEGLTTYVLNIIMFMPLGFLLPLLWKKYRKLSKVAVVGLLFSLSIELGQLFNRRQTDIDDLLMNGLGAIFGFGLWLIFNKLFKRKASDHHTLQDEPSMYLALSVLGTFFLYNWRWFLTFAA